MPIIHFHNSIIRSRNKTPSMRIRTSYEVWSMWASRDYRKYKVTDQIVFACNLSLGEIFFPPMFGRVHIIRFHYMSFSFRQTLPATIFRYCLWGYAFSFANTARLSSIYVGYTYATLVLSRAAHNFDILNLIFKKTSKHVMWYLCVCDKQIWVDLNLNLEAWDDRKKQKSHCAVAIFAQIRRCVWTLSERARF